MIEQLAGGGRRGGGWTSAMHFFDYNLDHFGLGTIDAPEWKIADRSKAYVTRAVAARAGLWGNHGYEADYDLVCDRRRRRAARRRQRLRAHVLARRRRSTRSGR